MNAADGWSNSAKRWLPPVSRQVVIPRAAEALRRVYAADEYAVVLASATISAPILRGCRRPSRPGRSEPWWAMNCPTTGTPVSASGSTTSRAVGARDRHTISRSGRPASAVGAQLVGPGDR